jgi:hypothetical protein
VDNAPLRPSRTRICVALATAVTATFLLCQVLAVHAAEPVPPPEKSTTPPPKGEPKPEAQKHKKLKKVMPVDDFGGY